MTKTDMENLVAPTARLFGYGLADGDGDMNKVGSDRSGFTYRAGVPPMYMSRTGKKVVRADVNGIGRLVSQAGFFNTSGGYYTFDPAVASAIGGYPYGAILRWKDPDSGAVRIVRSLKADNTADFVADPKLIDGVNWDFADNFLPSAVRPRVFPLWGKRTEFYLPIGETFTAERPGILLIQAGSDDDESVASGNSEVLVWADVRMEGEADFHSGGMLAYIPPVNNAYGVNSMSSQFVDGTIESKTGYTAKYVAGYVTLWLVAGDSVKISANTNFSFRSKAVYVPLVAKDEMPSTNP